MTTPSLVSTAQDWDINQLIKQGIESYQAGNYQQAIILWKQALTDAKTSSNSTQEAEILTYLGAAYSSLREYQQALDYYQKALDIFQSSNNLQQTVDILGKIGIIYYQLSQYHQAIQIHQQQLNLARQSEQLIAEVSALGNLAISHKALGNYQQSRQNLQQALQIIQPLSQPQLEAQLWINLGNTEESLGQYEKSRDAYQQSLEIAEEINNLEIQGIALSHLGILAANQGQWEVAIEFYQNSLALAQKSDDKEGIGHLSNNLGIAYQALGNLLEAEKYYQKSLEIANDLNHQRMKIAALGNLGNLYEKQQDYSQAIEYQQQSLAIANSLNLPQEQAKSLNNLAHIHLALNQLNKAENQLRNALNILDNLRNSLQDRDKISLFDTQLSSYNLLQQVLIAQQQPEAALEVSEWGRTRAFVELLVQKSLRSEASPLPPNITEIKQIARDQNATLVEYSIIPKDEFIASGKQWGDAAEIYIWVVKPDGKISFRSVQLDDLQVSLKHLAINTYLSMHRNQSSDTNLKKLYQLLIEPIAEQLPKKPQEKIIFISQSELFLVPFAALKNSQDEDLIQNHTIVTVPSIQVLASTHQRRQQIKQITDQKNTPLIVGNPSPMPEGFAALPGAEIEAKTIANILNTQPFVREAATETVIQQQLKTASIIHLATHGIFDASEPLKGAIALAPDGGDGLLTAEEILNLGYRLNAELVVLSACDTGRGQITGDGIIGLSRTLLAAGIPSAIVSLWPVPDKATAELMSRFYQAWQQHPDYANALRQAMLETRKIYPQPKNWAAFILIGESR
ncbi:MAG: CHAT domain-containing protein [Microcoleaceae cyanobacterium]